MFTVRNTLFGALLCAGWVLFLLVAPLWRQGTDVAFGGPLAAWAAMMHVWFLLAHLRLKERARQGKPGVWPVPSE